jgi:hypothetical protein
MGLFFVRARFDNHLKPQKLLPITRPAPQLFAEVFYERSQQHRTSRQFSRPGQRAGRSRVSVMKKAMNAQAASTMELLASVAQPAPALATSGNAGLLLHAVA